MLIITFFSKNPLTNPPCVAIIQKLSDSIIKFGGIAQLGERLNGIQEVSGSIPLISTKIGSVLFEKSPEIERFQDFFFVYAL